ncbi:MAG: hypothetical protein NTX45_11110 [Proteobacteria bacterium]|nr:hypothetical protein [Pseudomonadota bacterium]
MQPQRQPAWPSPHRRLHPVGHDPTQAPLELVSLQGPVTPISALTQGIGEGHHRTRLTFLMSV